MLTLIGDTSDTQGGEFTVLDEQVLGWTNHAGDERISTYIMQNIHPICNAIKHNRKPQEDRWIACHELRSLQVGGAYKTPSGIRYSDPHRLVEDMSVYTVGQLFPTEDYLSALASKTDSTSKKNAKIAALFVKSDFKRAKVKKRMKLFIKQLWMYGWSVGAIDWLDETSTIFDRKEIIEYGQPQSQTTATADPNAAAQQEVTAQAISSTKIVKRKIKKTHPTFRPVSIFNVYSYPTSDFDTAEIVFENGNITMEEVNRYKANGVFINTEQIAQGSFVKDEASRDPEEFEALYNMSEADNLRYRNKRTIYARIPFEKDGDLEPALIIMSGTTILRVQRNPFFLQKPPYVGTSIGEILNEKHPISKLEIIAPAYRAKNDTANQILMAWRYANNPIGMVDPASPLGKIYQSVKLKAGMMVPAKAGDLTFERWPSPAPEAYQFLDPLSAEIDSSFGYSPLLSGQTGSSAIRTNKMQASATGGATKGIVDIAESIEDAVLVPLANWFYSLRYQKSPDTMLDTSIIGADAVDFITKRPKFKDIIDDYTFEFLGSSKSYANAVSNQQLMQFLAGIAPLIPRMEQEGTQVSVTEIAKDLYTNGLLLGNEKGVFIDMSRESFSPEIENAMLAQGQEIDIAMGDDDPYHIGHHLNQLKEYDNAGEDVENIVVSLTYEHINKHKRQWKVKLDRQLKMQQQQMAQMVAQKTDAMVQGAVQGSQSIANTNTPSVQAPATQLQNSAPTGESMRSPEAVQA